MSKTKYRYFVGDFETTVYEGQRYTEVWASALVELFTEDVHILHSIDDTFNYLISLNSNLWIYYHNLKFDGNFWLSFLLLKAGYTQAFVKTDESTGNGEWLSDKDMPSKSFKYSISNMGMWYSMTIKVGRHIIKLVDSLKILPFSVKEIGEGFKTKHQKLDMEYKGFRYAGCVITDDEKEYIKNDVLVIKEAVEILHNEGHTKLTIGSCCLSEFKDTLFYDDFDRFFPQVYDINVKSPDGYINAGEWIRKSYKGGWCYLVPQKRSKVYHKGLTADVNSLYPSVMHSESGNYYPIGKPTFWFGNFMPTFLKKCDTSRFYYFIKIKTRFYLKEGYLPFIQIKNNALYKRTECLTTSDIYDKKTGQYYSEYIDFDGELRDTRVELTLTMTDYLLFLEHYAVVDFEIIEGCYFSTEIGLFDEYINKYKEQKMNNKGAKRTLAKLFLNNLYGKMATNKDSTFKVAYLKEDNSIGFYFVEEHKKKPGYIPIGSAITSYARNFTIRAAQKNYHGKDKPGFIYADTDSIHCDLDVKDLKGVTIHDTNFNSWKIESVWSKGYFVRQKTYIEIVEEGGNIEYDIKCAGMPERCKKLFISSITDNIITDDMTDEEKEFVKVHRKLTDFNLGLKIPGKLRPVRIPGGVVLIYTTYEMR